MPAPQPLQAGPRKLKKDKSDNVKKRMTLVFRKTFAIPASPPRRSVIEAPRPRYDNSPSNSLPRYTVFSTTAPSRALVGPPPEVIHQPSTGTTTREYGRSNKPQPASTEGLVARRSHVGAGVVGTSPPLPPIPRIIDARTTEPDRSSDGLGISLDLRLASPEQRGSPSSNGSTRKDGVDKVNLDFPVLANVSHVQPLRLEGSRDRLQRTRASVSEASNVTAAMSKTRGANRIDSTKCYTIAAPSSLSGLDIAFSRPPKSALRPLKSAVEAPVQSVIPSAAWTRRTDSASRETHVAPTTVAAPPAGLYCLRPTVNASTQTPADWMRESVSVAPPPPSFRRASSTTPPQAFSSFGVFAPLPIVPRHAVEVAIPSPSIYSISSFDARSRTIGHGKQDSQSSFYAPTAQIREDDEDLQDVIDRHLGELAGPHRHEVVNYDVPFLEPSPYDTPQLRPFEIPPTPLAAQPVSEGQVPSPAITAEGATPTLDQTPTIPSSFATSRPARSTSPLSNGSRSTSSLLGSSPSSTTSRESNEPLTPPTSAPPSTFEEEDDEVSIQLAEQEPIQIRKASLVNSSMRKSSLVSCKSASPCGSRRQSTHSISSGSVKSVKFNPEPKVSIIPFQPSTRRRSSAAAPAEPTISPSPPPSPEWVDEDEPAVDGEPAPHVVAAVPRRRSESDTAVARARTNPVMSRAERAARGRSYFLVQALMGEQVSQDGMGMIRDWARDSDDETEEGETSEAESDMY
ncbi:hypothetical protein JCM10212_001991 [Sporobolomyces blumeae]